MRLLLAIFLSLTPLVFADDIFIDGGSQESVETLEFQGASSENVSPTSKARIYFDTDDNKLKLSENGGAYTDIGAAGGAPTDADYLVGTANGSLSAEIVVGTSPGGQLGGTWASPTIDDLFVSNTSDIMTGTLTVEGTSFTLGKDAVNATRTQTIWAENGYEAILKFFETPTYGMGLRYNATENILYWDRYVNSATPTGSNMAYRVDGTTVFEGNTLVVDVPDGRVGIGTDDPQRPLHMVGAGTSETGWARFGLSTTEYTEIGHRGNNSAINAVGDGNLDFRHDGTTRASLSDAGVFTAATFAGALTGNASGSSGSCTGNAATVTTNANLTGEVTSAGNAAVLSPTCISGKAEVTSTDLDYILVSDQSDGGALKKVDMAEVRGGAGGGLNNIVEDTTPQLGGNLDAQSYGLTFTPTAHRTVIDISGNNLDLVWMLGHATDGYGHYWKYEGTGGGDANYLYQYAENGAGADFWHLRYHQINHDIDVNSDLIMQGSYKLIGDVTGDVSGSSGSCTGNAATATTASGLSCTDCVQATEIETINCGRSTTWDATNDEVDADAETYVARHSIAFEDPVSTDDFFFGEVATASTWTSIYCKTLVGTCTLDVQIAGTDINGTDITCTTAGVLDSSLGGDTAGAVGEEVKLAITSVASSPTYLMVILNGTYND